MREHERWLKIVDDDIKSAKGLLCLEVFSTATYHCQQAAEKALKAYLVFKNQKVKKIHDLIEITALCCELDKEFERLYDDVEHLNPFATKFRYPTEFDIPDYDDTKQAIEQTERIINFVLKKITEPKTGQQELF
jgi:HEPN domain-containing protein